jgi:hypothetical protein
LAVWVHLPALCLAFDKTGVGGSTSWRPQAPELCGLASAIGWLALPLDSAQIAAIVLVVTAMVVTIVHLLRLSRPRKDEPAHGLN